MDEKTQNHQFNRYSADDRQSPEGTAEAQDDELILFNLFSKNNSPSRIIFR